MKRLPAWKSALIIKSYVKLMLDFIDKTIFWHKINAAAILHVYERDIAHKYPRKYPCFYSSGQSYSYSWEKKSVWNE